MREIDNELRYLGLVEANQRGKQKQTIEALYSKPNEHKPSSNTVHYDLTPLLYLIVKLFCLLNLTNLQMVIPTFYHKFDPASFNYFCHSKL